MDADNLRWIVLDTETTGVGSDARVCEIAWIEIDLDTNVIDRRYSLIDPQIQIPASASGVHGITNADVVNSPTLDEFFDIVLPGEGGSIDGTFILIAHNAVFDRRFVGHHIPIFDEICTLRLARRTWPEMENHKLATLMYALGLKRGQSHSADGDVDTCHDLLVKIVEATNLPLIELIDLTKAPRLVEIMPFGKHKGTPLPAVPRSYVSWLLKQDLDADMRYSLGHYGLA